ncbi:PIG-L deacetylase family protein [Terriglobus aquaticus]|uniref:PIG-L deacetylase family protein n=1 Tax=Terriglobus aquaticus TaxID=940139 RepID=A0ABW9KMU9_9BACT|nr:PIG-L family deacetylase [Terriglobus aquaticus]
MIVPITLEPEWQAALSAVPSWQPPLVPTVVVAPHPDDETLAAGGLIAHLRERETDVRVIAATDGEHAYEGETGLGPIREVEQQQALERLGVEANSIHRLRLCDSGLSALETELALAMEPLLRDARHIVAPWPHDFHPDHEVTGRVALALANRLGIPLTWYFFWTWHRGRPDLLHGLPLRKLLLSAAEQQAKREALAFHVSQLQHSSGEPILPENLLEPAWRSFEVFLPA